MACSQPWSRLGSEFFLALARRKLPVCWKTWLWWSNEKMPLSACQWKWRVADRNCSTSTWAFPTSAIWLLSTCATTLALWRRWSTGNSKNAWQVRGLPFPSVLCLVPALVLGRASLPAPHSQSSPGAVLSPHQPCPALDALLSLQAERTGAMTQALLPLSLLPPFPFPVSLQQSWGLLGSPGILQKPRKGPSSGPGFPAAALTPDTPHPLAVSPPGVGRAAGEVPSLCCLTAPRWTSPLAPRSAGRRQRRSSATCTTGLTCRCCPRTSAPGGKATRLPGAEEWEMGLLRASGCFISIALYWVFESL